jgi:hypothetical protein
MVPVQVAGSPWLHRYHMGRYNNMGVAITGLVFVEGEDRKKKKDQGR